MAYTTIDKPSDYFETKLWTGNGSSQNITGLNFQPDWVWTKDRDDTSSHAIVDAVRGNEENLSSNSIGAEVNETNRITSFNSDGYSLGAGGGINQNGAGNVGWNWKANGTGSANTDGSINSTVSANTTAGFSIVSWSGTGSNGTIGHGLGDTPSLMIIKNRNNVGEWRVWNSTFNADQYLYLNRTDAVATQSILFNSTLPTSSVISAGTSGDINSSGRTYIAYCFAEKTGYSKFGSYTGNGNADGTFVYTGFKPAFVMVDNTQQADDWYMFDNKRSSYNQVQANLKPNTNSAEASSTSYAFDFLSNGFKVRASTGAINNNNEKIIYMAFAEAPLVGSNGVTAKAR